MVRVVKGFTIIEVIVAAVLIGLGIVAVVAAMSKGVMADHAIDGQAVALRLAQEEIETARNTDYSNLSNALDTGGIYKSWPNAPFSNDYKYKVVVQANPNGESGLTQVTVNVQWNFKASTMTVTLTTLLSAIPATTT